MISTLIFGGTFDPVHIGHLRSARALADIFPASRLVFVPCKLPVHRPEPGASAEDRLAMLNLAIEGEKAFSCDDCELQRDGYSYTFDTLRHYRLDLGEASLIFVMGLDAWMTLPGWHKWSSLCDLAHLIILKRPDAADQVESKDLSDWAGPRLVQDPAELLNRPSGTVCHITLEQVDVSATRIRRAIRQGDAVADVLHPEVTKYITRHNLYMDNQKA